MINDETYNAFARGLAGQIRQRAKGLDDESARVVNARPQEHILAGFLTPRSHLADDAASGDSENDDLPRDSSFELTSLGLEWLADFGALSHVTSLSISASVNVYVRCTPSFEEQRRLGSWRREHGGGAQVQKTQAIVPVWKRVRIPEFSLEVDVPNLIRDKRQRIEISSFLNLPVTVIPPDIYSGRRPVYLTENECQTEAAFAAAVSRARTQPFVSFWAASVDVRLISVPTERNAVRVAMRVIN
ncbi:MAG TPA: hypothetical protein VJR04_12500, partial [Terriglobales bacterium]|nr:hypothetical protein [Terriglobales bacterium]